MQHQQQLLPESIFSMHGWCTRDKAERIYQLVRDAKPAEVVELGVFAGRSFVPLALGLKHNGKGVITGIDPWAKSASTEHYDSEDENYQWWNSLDHEAIFQWFLKALDDYGVREISKYMRTVSKECAHLFEDESIGVLHQDGNHSVASSCEEVEIYAPKVTPGGYWIMDDTNWDTTLPAQNLILEKGFDLLEDHKEWRLYIKRQ
jgi:hypothetical protein